MWASGPFFWSSCIKSSSLLFTTSYCQMVIKRAGWNITNDSNMAHGPPSCDQFDPSPRWITKKKSIQRKCLHQDLIKPKDLGNHSEKQICETIPSDNSWKYPYLLDSEPSKGSVVMRHISNISTCFCISELFACLQFTERSNNLFAIQVNVVIPLRNSF